MLLSSTKTKKKNKKQINYKLSKIDLGSSMVQQRSKRNPAELKNKNKQTKKLATKKNIESISPVSPQPPVQGSLALGEIPSEGFHPM